MSGELHFTSLADIGCACGCERPLVREWRRVCRALVDSTARLNTERRRLRSLKRRRAELARRMEAAQ